MSLNDNNTTDAVPGAPRLNIGPIVEDILREQKNTSKKSIIQGFKTKKTPTKTPKPNLNGNHTATIPRYKTLIIIIYYRCDTNL